jgi:hypothetical protein
MRKPSITSRRGIATLLVLSVIALASVLGMAIIANTSLQSQISQNQIRAVQGDALAESGLNLAQYYLLNPSKAPSLGSGGYYAGETGISLGTSMSGTVKVSVSQVTPGDLYDITSTSHGTDTGSSRTLKLRIQTKNAPQKYAISSAGSLNLPANVIVNGDVAVLKTFSTSSGAKVNGTAYVVTAGTNAGTVSGGVQLENGGYFSIPASTTDYRTYKYYNGSRWVSGTAQDLYSFSLLGNITGLILPITLGPSTSNPAGIFYTTRAIEIDDNVTINGTVIINGANLTFAGRNITINAASTFPAVIVNGNINTASSNPSVTVNGVTWLSGSMTSSGGSSSAIYNFNGSVIFGGSSPSISSGMGTVTMTYDASKCSVTHLGPDDSVAAVTWSQ